MDSRFINDFSRSIFAVLIVVQSLFRMPPVSPELGFHDQNVQEVPLRPL